MSTAKFDTLQNAAGTKSVPVATVVDGSAKAWVNFNGTGTVAIRGSFNVTSITDNGVGDYTVNFTTAIVDANYGVGLGCKNDNSRGNTLQVAGTPTTTAVQLNNREYNGTAFASADVTFGYVAIFR